LILIYIICDLIDLYQVTRAKRNVIGERQYSVFTTTPFVPAVSTGKITLGI